MTVQSHFHFSAHNRIDFCAQLIRFAEPCFLHLKQQSSIWVILEGGVRGAVILRILEGSRLVHAVDEREHQRFREGDTSRDWLVIPCR